MKLNSTLSLPLWLLLASVVGYTFSEHIIQFRPALVPVIGLIMFVMGLTITPGDVMAALKKPQALIIGVVLQFLLMPAVAWLISRGFGLPTDMLIGMVLVGSAPGGTASNVLAYLAGGRVALSVSMTTVSTLLSIVVTPWLVGFYLDTVVAVDRMAILVSIGKMILIPVVAGMLVKWLLPNLLAKVVSALPKVAILGIATAVCIIIALNAHAMASLTFAVLGAVILHNVLGLFGAYGLARWCGQDEASARTIAIEVGTQNSGMSAALAVQHFAALAAIPSALFSIIQNLIGAALAGYWSGRSGSGSKAAVKEKG